jgi:hypothetical protein
MFLERLTDFKRIISPINWIIDGFKLNIFWVPLTS